MLSVAKKSKYRYKDTDRKPTNDIEHECFDEYCTIMTREWGYSCKMEPLDECIATEGKNLKKKKKMKVVWEKEL